MMTNEEAFKTLKENLCSLCAYGSQNMKSCDIRNCDNRDAIKTIEISLCDSCATKGCIFQSGIVRNHCDFYEEYKSKQLIDELSKMPPMVIATAYLHAINYVKYGEDVTKKWVTAIQQTSALEKAYQEGYYDALQRQEESEDKECI